MPLTRRYLRFIEIVEFCIMWDIVKAVIVGVVEGLTEFLPVSSTGHMVIVGSLINFQGALAESFEVFIQLGAILAVVYLYPYRFSNLLNFKSSRGFDGFNGLKLLALGCLPAFVAGALLHSTIKAQLMRPYPVALALFTGGLLIILLESRLSRVKTNDIHGISYRQALLVGVFQCFALWPGMSRSASTIIGGLLVGLDRKVAAEFSFLLAVPVMCGATAFDLLKSHSSLDWSAIPIFAVGFVVSFVVAAFAVKWFVALLARSDMRGFGYYRLVVGGGIILLYEMGLIS